jgi:hypothetical protein
MPLTTLYALISLQYAVVGGLICFLCAWHFSTPEWRQLPMVQRRLRKYSARRLRFSAIYLRVVGGVFGVGTLVALAFAGFAFYQSVATPTPRLMTLADISDSIYLQIIAVALQIYLLAGYFIQWFRVRRAQRAMVLEELAALGAASAACV